MVDLKRKIKENFSLLSKEIREYPAIYLLLSLVLILGLFLRTYRSSELMGFYYDQGRDALVIWKLWNEGKPFLIGPVTGLTGIFLGPFFYYLIAPFYLIGGGDPVIPVSFLSFLTVLSCIVVYYLGSKFLNRETGLFAATISSLSYYLVLPGRWLSNPTPIFLTSVILLLSMWKISHHKDKRWWIVAALMLGLSLQFEAASAFFYIPILIIFAIIHRAHLPGLKLSMISLSVLFATLLPQIIFNFRHENLLLNNFTKLFSEGKSFRLDFWQVLEKRAVFFWTVFYSKIYPQWQGFAAIFALISLTVIMTEVDRLKREKALPLLVLFLIVPVVGYLLFQGNYGNIYDYYMTGYYLPMILLFSLGLGLLWEDKYGKITVLLFFLLFFVMNGSLLYKYLNVRLDSPETINLGTEIEAVDWVFNNARDKGRFNVDVYVPPVIPYSYDYLFLWRGTRLCGENLCGLVKEERRDLLYTLYEIDTFSPERLDAWLLRQENIGLVEEEVRFGGIIVQRRKRI